MREVRITEHDTQVYGDLYDVKGALGLVVVPYADSEGRKSEEAKDFARYFNEHDISVLNLDLLSLEESKKKEYKYNVKLLSLRLEVALDWTKRHRLLRDCPLGIHASYTAAAATMEAAAHTTMNINAVVAFSGRIDMVEKYLPFVEAPCLLIVDGKDQLALQANKKMMPNLACVKLHTISENNSSIDEEIIRESSRWFKRYFAQKIYEERKDEYKSENLNLPFYDRYEASHFLSYKLQKFKEDNPLILAIPRGAVAMADVIATELDMDMDIILVKKLGAPNHPELAIGSINEFGDVYLSSNAKAYADEEYISQEAAKKQAQLSDYRKKFQGFKTPQDVKDRTVIIVDDGIATGSTMLSAVITVKEKGARKVVVAAPVASRSAQKMLQLAADETVFLDIPENFYAVAQFYENFPQVNDDEVEKILR
ncbi:MAG: hypothetical protein CME64_11425 [Halobacteriovoraceae bacterium]|nr:hypothetical protein [Halobacteriovoraceae bacterium]|tara:strand:- start:33662 stop:34936 length:1275 start_codon:yes stop_codon:yes gene_type:complete